MVEQRHNKPSRKKLTPSNCMNARQIKIEKTKSK